MYRMVPVKIFRRLVWGSMVLAGISCRGYRQLSVEVLQPSLIPVSTEKRIALLDRNIWRKDSVVVMAGDIFGELQQDVSREFYRGMSYIAAGNGFSDTIIRLPLSCPVILEKGEQPVALSADTVWDLCRKFKADYIVSIESSAFVEPSNRSLNWERTVYLYSPFSGQFLDSVVLTGKFRVMENAYTLYEDIVIDSWDQGENYAKRIMPYWSEMVRRAYVRGKVLRLGYSYLKAEKEEQALQVWEGALKLSGRMAVRAAVNMAWVYERAGHFSRAIKILEQISQSAQSGGIKCEELQYVREYLKILTRRIEDGDLLELQAIPAK